MIRKKRRKAFCFLQPRKGDSLLIGKTGKDKETKWFVGLADEVFKDELPTIQVEEEQKEMPF